MRNAIKMMSAILVVFAVTTVLAENQNNQYQSNNNRGHHRRPKLTDEQRTCLESKIGRPGEGPRPSKEEFEAAHAECGIELPDLPPREEE